MGRSDATSKVIDEIIRYGTFSVAAGTSLVLPGVMIGLKGPLQKLYEHLDKREKEREVRRILYYMKEQGYLAGEYNHGLQLTAKARRRLSKNEEMPIAKPQAVWDKWWRIIIYDIPNDKESARHALQAELRQYGCYILQRSVYITPFPCLGDIEAIAARHDVDRYVTYFEAKNLANAAAILRLFKKKYPQTRFQ